MSVSLLPEFDKHLFGDRCLMDQIHNGRHQLHKWQIQLLIEDAVSVIIDQPTFEIHNIKCVNVA